MVKFSWVFYLFDAQKQGGFKDLLASARKVLKIFQFLEV